ncbi:MAG TPA: hypothetical protein EYQ08_00790 [Planctomycetes bacterium]|nr:hypothetical protein [Planctomycetota bacterium]HIK82057.1 hypothetical protein [Planctomycetota bacterium]
MKTSTTHPFLLLKLTILLCLAPIHGSASTVVMLDDPAPAVVTKAQETAARVAMDKMQKRMDEAWTEYLAPLREAKTAEERDAIELDPEKDPGAMFLPELFKFSSDHPGTTACLEALSQLISMASRDEKNGWILEQVVDRILVDYIEHPDLKDLVRFGHYNPPSAQNLLLLRAVADRSPHRSVQGSAFYALGKLLGSSEETRAEGKQLLERVQKEFADVPFFRETTYGEKVAGDLFELDHLQVGQVAPEIIGASIDGNLMQLSAFRGKVVLIDFWGDW